MDRLPLVPQNEEDHDILPLITEAFQDAFQTNKYPRNVAENLRKYVVESEFSDYQTNGVETLQIWDAVDPHLEDILKVEEEIMRTHALAMISKEENVNFLETLKLKRCALFQKLSDYAIQTYGLIQRHDLYPNAIEQYLDFTYNPNLHTCKQPCPFSVPPKVFAPLVKPKPKRQLTDVKPTSPFRADPEKIVFHNYSPGQIYKTKLRLRNVGNTPHNFNLYLFPKSSPFSVEMSSGSWRLAPGMSAEFLVTFRPTDYTNYSEFIKFKTIKGVDFTVPVMNLREPPSLICYVVNPVLPLDAVKKPAPGSKYFSERRCNALNFTIDCGTCLLGNYALMTVIMKNEGQKGRFLLTTEKEWCWGTMNEDGTRLLELTQGCFIIFPVLFEIDRDEICQIFVVFLPNKVGFFSEKLYMVCDNYAHQELEIIGDCVIFSSAFLKVNMYLLENTFMYYHRLIKITLVPFQSAAFIFSIINNSAIHFEYYWAIKTSIQDEEDVKKMGADWIKIMYNTQFLPSFSTTDVVVQLTPQTAEEGLYSSYLSLYLKNIPIASMDESNDFVIRKNDVTGDTRDCDISCKPPESTNRNEGTFDYHKMADVHICQLEIMCDVEIPIMAVSTVTTVSIQVVDDTKDISRLKLSKGVLNFGVIPIKVTATDCLTVENLTDDEIDWKLIEIEYVNDQNLRVIAESKHLSQTKGTLTKRRKRKLSYTTDSEEPIGWVSILVLFSCPSCTCQAFVVESVCLVTYEVAQINIIIRTDNRMNVLCPKESIYIGIPTIHTVYVHNAGITISCFYFLKPIGEHAQKLRLKFHPQSGIVNPGCTVEVKVELLTLEPGLIDRVYVPCFVGNPDRLKFLSVLCHASNISVHFYLPNRDTGYNRYLWPLVSKELALWDKAAVGEDGFQIDAEDAPVINEPSVSTLDETLLTLISKDSIAATYPTVKTKQIQVKQPYKLTFYIENLTPIHGDFVVRSCNYGPEDECIDHVLVKAKTRTPEFFWEKECMAGYGIVIEPVRPSGNIIAFEVVELDMWIYANTWGMYLEEIIVEINDLTPFCFNLIVQVVGLPIEFPFARNTTLPVPTIRFENVAYATESTTKCFTVTNISAIPVQLTWHIYTPVNHTHQPSFNILLEIDDEEVTVKMAREFYGCEACSKCIQLRPFDFQLDKQATREMGVMFSAKGFTPSMEESRIRYTLIGFIGLREQYKFKENYFRRDYGSDATAAKVEVLVTLELPMMQIEGSTDETQIDLFVNDILLEHMKFPQVYLLLRNIHKCVIRFAVDIDKPFQIVQARTVPEGHNNPQELELQRNECLQLLVTCNFSNEELLEYADVIYQHQPESDEQQEIPEESFISVIKKDLNIFQKGIQRQMIPFQIRLHFPHIVVKPEFIKFGQVLLFRAKKTILSIYNMTGSTVKFEIFKTTKHDDFEVVPNHGEIARSTGVNKQFADVALYFTPRHCKIYQESLRVTTNIPKHYVDVTVSGVGTTNEKFDVD